MRELLDWKRGENRKPLLLKGARQVGKTYLLKQFGREEFVRCHYVNFEEDDRLARFFARDLKPRRILDDLSFHLNTPVRDTEDEVLILDEIQRCPRALTALKYFCEEMPGLAVCAAGSLLGIELGGESFPVGKVHTVALAPMSFEEFLEGVEEVQLLDALTGYAIGNEFSEAAHDRLWEQWKRFLLVGGLPEAVVTFRQNLESLHEAVSSVRRVQRQLLDDYMADIAKHSGKLNALTVERLWRNIPEQLARSQDRGAEKFRFKDAVPGARGYQRLAGALDWLERANLTLRCPIVERPERPLSAYAKENRFKLYFFDVGLLSFLCDLAPAQVLDYGRYDYKGYVVENCVAQMLTAADVRRCYCWQGRTSEVEFLLATEQGVVPVEVKAGRIRHSKSLRVYEDRYQPTTSVLLNALPPKRKGKRVCLPLFMAGRLPNIMASA